VLQLLHTSIHEPSIRVSFRVSGEEVCGVINCGLSSAASLFTIHRWSSGRRISLNCRFRICRQNFPAENNTGTSSNCVLHLSQSLLKTVAINGVLSTLVGVVTPSLRSIPPGYGEYGLQGPLAVCIYFGKLSTIVRSRL